MTTPTSIRHLKILGCILIFSSSILAQTGKEYLVTNTNDSGLGSLRAAVDSSFVNVGTDTIKFDPNINGDTIKLTTGQIVLDTTLVILGNGWDNTILDGSDNSRIFQIPSGDTAIVQSLTLQGGNAKEVLNDNSGVRGGAIQNRGVLSISACKMVNNKATVGGAIENDEGKLTLRKCKINGNYAKQQAGGIYTDGALTLAELVLDQCEIQGNTADIFAGAILTEINSVSTIQQSVISGNSANTGGGGIFHFAGSLAINNSTISGNTASNNPGGVYFFGGELSITNSVIAKNTASTSPDILALVPSLSVTNTLIGDTTGISNATGFGAGNIFGNTMHPIDPLFLQDVPSNDSLGGNLRLLPCSPAVDAGEKDSLSIADTLDLDGNTRVFGSEVDMGAYEYLGIPFADTLLVITTYDSGCGSLRYAVANANANDTITFDPSINGDTVKLTAGQILLSAQIVIIGNDTTNTIIDGQSNDRIFEISQVDTVEIYSMTLQNGKVINQAGGAIKNEAAYFVLKDCKIAHNKIEATQFQVLSYGGGLYSALGNIRLENNLFIENSISAEMSNARGGGMYAEVDSAWVLKNRFFGNVIESNTSNSWGAGLYLSSQASTFFENYIIGNRANSKNGQSLGGGLFYRGGPIHSQGNIIVSNLAEGTVATGGGIQTDGLFYSQNDQILGNKVVAGNFGGIGGGIYTGKSMHCKNSTISGNSVSSTSSSDGGGLYTDGKLLIVNSQLSGNQAISTVNQATGGAIFVAGIANVRNSTITGNRSTTNGGGIHNGDQLQITNTIIANNTSLVAPDLFSSTGNTFSDYSLIGDTISSKLVVGAGNIFNLDPLFVQDVPIDDSLGGDLRLQACSPAINAGINDSLMIGDTSDLLGNSRIADTTVDMGAYEFTDPAPTDSIFYAACPCPDTLVITDLNISGLYKAANVIELKGNATLNGDTEFRAREVLMDPMVTSPQGVRFDLLLQPCSTANN